jgi:nucleotide-binding universal stress UspA family protein
MDRALAVVRSDDDAPLITEAVSLASGVDADVVVLSLLTPEEFEKDASVLNTIEDFENVESGERSQESLAKSIGREMYRDAVSDVDADVDVDVVGAVSDDDQSETVLRVARNNDCDHIFLSGGKRSPAGKALFGDVTQSVLLGFDGYVTVRMTE